MDILKRIINNKLVEIKACKKKQTLEDLKQKVGNSPKPRNFKKAISKKNKLCIIAEIKKTSPSAGIIRKDFNPVKLAIQLEKEKADALSVLTDKKFFKGDISYIKKIKKRVNLPILRKDFIIDEYQVYESCLYGADAILLISRILSINKLKRFYRLACQLGLDCLVEVHTLAELKKALKIGPEIIGINNRNLANLKMDTNISLRLARLVPKEKIIISESGIDSREYLNRLKEKGINAALIGEALMRQKSFNNVFKFSYT